MINPEILAKFQGQDLNALEDQRPIERKSFENFKRFLAYGAIASVRIYEQGVKPDYSDKNIYYPIPGKFTNLQNWERNLKITYDYAFGEETMEEIGNRNGNLTVEAVSLIIERTVKGLRSGADEAARNRFPLDSFDFKKPLTLASRQRFSEVRGGISFQFARKLDQGGTLAEIIKELKKAYTTNQITGAMRVLKSWGYKFEREQKTTILSRFEGLRNPNTTCEERQTLLDQIRGNEQRQVLKQAGLILNLSRVAKKAGLYIWSNQVECISESLRRKKLPQRKIPNKRKDKNGQQITVYYYVIAFIDESDAIDILKAEHNLDYLRINPVRQIAGPEEEKLPNTTKLKSQEYAPVSNLIGEIRGSRWTGRGKGGLKTDDIIEGSPVGIYAMDNRNGTLYRKDQKGELRGHLESQMRTLSVI